MARLPFADIDDPERAPIAARIGEERGELLKLHQMLLHAPAIAEPWVGFFNGIRWNSGLSDDLRELVIMRIGHLNKAAYEVFQHRPYALKAGLSEEKLAVLGQDPLPGIFSAKEALVLDYCDAMTKSIAVDDALFERMRSAFSEPEIVELTTTIAAYNMVSRILVALEISPEDEA